MTILDVKIILTLLMHIRKHFLMQFMIPLIWLVSGYRGKKVIFPYQYFSDWDFVSMFPNHPVSCDQSIRQIDVSH